MKKLYENSGQFNIKMDFQSFYYCIINPNLGGLFRGSF